MTFQSFLNHPGVQALGQALLHFVWQGGVLAAIFFVADTIARHSRANLRYAIGCLVMLSMPVVFVATALRSEPSPAAPLPMQHSPAIHRDGWFFGGSTVTMHVANRTVSPARSVPTLFPGWIVCFWMAGVAVLSLCTAVGWMRAQRLTQRGAEPAGAAWIDTMEDLIRRLRISRPVRLSISAIPEVPAVIGWLRPCILLPVSAITGLSESQLRALLAHELAHVRRYDYLVNLLQNAVETLLFYHPAVWWVSRRIRQERENCCDDLAVEVCGDVMLYATALTCLEEIRGSVPEPALAATGGDLLTRIRRLTGQTRQKDFSAMPTAAAVIATAIAAAIAGVVVIGAGVVPAIHAQQPTLRFEAASVKPTLNWSEYVSREMAAGRTSGGGIRTSGLHLDIDNMSMLMLIGTAYRFDSRIIAGPDWVNGNEVSFSIHAVMPEGSASEQVPDMMRALLEERFHLATHRAVVAMPAYAITIGKNGPRLKPARDLDASACDDWVDGPVGSDNRICRSSQVIGDRTVRVMMMTKTQFGPLYARWLDDERREEYFRMTMVNLAELMTLGLSPRPVFGPAAGPVVPVVDRTGIQGAWDVVLDTSGGADEKLSSYSASLEKQGLRLERTTAPVEKLVIDRIDKVPTEN